jgi:hypothetical protein
MLSPAPQEKYMALHPSMRKLCLASALVACASSVLAEDVPLTAEEFWSLMVNKTVKVQALSGKAYETQLKEDGRAVVAIDYNDVGRWRQSGPNGYCVIWNKQAPAEYCYTLAKRDGKVAFFSSDGKLGSWVVSSR